jgi:hypothetical protein
VLKTLFAGLLREKNTAEWLLILLISPNEQGANLTQPSILRVESIDRDVITSQGIALKKGRQLMPK